MISIGQECRPRDIVYVNVRDSRKRSADNALIANPLRPANMSAEIVEKFTALTDELELSRELL